MNTMAGFIVAGLAAPRRPDGRGDRHRRRRRPGRGRRGGRRLLRASGQVSSVGVSLPGAGVDGTWTLPEGWEVPTFSSSSEVLDGRVILERIDPPAPAHDIAGVDAGRRATSTDRSGPVGDRRDHGPGRHAEGGVGRRRLRPASAGCGLVITDLDTMESRTVARPEFGFIGGGAFSDDGSRLAVFVAGQENMPIEPVGRPRRGRRRHHRPAGASRHRRWRSASPIGSATWTLDNSSVIFHGLSETRVIDVTTGAQRTLPWEITYSMATIP